LIRLAKDPTLYRNLNDSTTSLSVLLRNLEPVVRDLRIFSDKVARHPELLGVQGALRGSAGVKEVPGPVRSAKRGVGSPR
jgi:phospholipid/cholesterol/gamma-HCH transport system substrate-binding protein